MNKERLMQILKAPHVSEKSTNVADAHNQIVFKVAPDASKPEIARAVELMFEVKVREVTVVNLPAKRKSFGRIQGRRSGWRKAYVRLAEGHQIDFAGVE